MSSSTAPDWLYLPLPANADPDPKLLETVEQACSKLPEKFAELQKTLTGVRTLASYEPAVNRANELIWGQFESLLGGPSSQGRKLLVDYAKDHMQQRLLARVLRRLAKA